MVYDRVQNYRHDIAARNAVKEKATWKDYNRCIDGLPYAPGVDEEQRRAWLRARAYCRVNLGESPEEIGKQLNSVGVGK